jgi:polygalacturonase
VNLLSKLLATFACVIAFALLVHAQPTDLPKWINDVGARRAPNAKRTCLVDAAGDRVAISTKAIQHAIDVCAKSGGGIVTFKPGNYITGALFLKSNVHLRVDTGVTLTGSQDDADYPLLWTRVAGIEMKWPAALINVNEERNVKISGGGTIDGNGEKWWDRYWTLRREYEPRGLRWASDYDAQRVRLMVIWKSSDVTIENLSLKRSGFWTLQAVYSDHVTVDRIKITDNRGPSTDGVDIDSSSYVLVQNCDIDNNDDDICLKAGRDFDGLRVNRPTEYVVIRDNITRHGGGVISFGSETSGGIRKVVAYHNRGIGTNEGIRFKSAKTRGGYVEDILIRDLEMENVPLPFTFTLNWNPSYSYAIVPSGSTHIPAHWITLSTHVDPPERGLCEFRNIRIQNVEIVNAGQIFSAKGLPEKPIVDVSFANVTAQGIDAGSIEYARNWTMRNVRLETKTSLKISNAQNVESPDTQAPANPKLPTIFVIGDSTANNHANGALGWGDPFIGYFDPAQVNVLNRARAGRSSRTFITEGLWDKVLGDMKKGDVVLIQFGHNDAGAINDTTRARGSVPGVGEETQEIDNLLTKKHEVVHTYGWYLRKMISDTRAKGAVPVLLSLTVRNIWKDGRVERGSGKFSQWAAEVARSQNVEFIDLTTIIADRYEQLGQERVQALFGPDHTHTSPAGAELNAELVVTGLKTLKHCKPCKYLSSKAKT